MTITHGVVSFEDGVKASEEYAPAKKVRVELSFTTPDGEDEAAYVAHVGDIARAQVARLLNQASSAAGEAPAPVATRTRRTKAQIAADEAAAKEAGAPTTGDAGGVQTSGDPAAIEDVGVDFEDVVDVDASVVEALPEEDFTIAPEVIEAISDADLNSHVQRKNGEIKDAKAIRELIGTYNSDPTKVFQLREIPAEKRREFLDKLAALKPASA